MNVEKIMTRNPQLCTPESGIRDVARMMCERDCGEIPVVANESEPRLIGVITDRDITCRLVAKGKNPLEMKVGDCMTKPAQSVQVGSTIDEACQVLRDRQIRRLPVVNEEGECVGILSQADIARKLQPELTGEVLREVSA